MENNQGFFRNHILTFIISLVFLFIFFYLFNITKYFFPDYPDNHNFNIPKKLSGYYANIIEDIAAESDIKYALNNKSIVVFGSSELSHSDFSSIPYRFIYDSLKYPILAVGHAGDQSMAMISQLMYHEKYLSKANIVLIISPGWFLENYSGGTSIPCFLEYNNERTLNSILFNKNIKEEFKNYVFDYISKNYNNIKNPSYVIDYINTHASVNNIENIEARHNYFSEYITRISMKNRIKLYDYLYKLKLIKEPLGDEVFDEFYKESKINIVPKSFNWNNIFIQSIEKHKKISDNNNIGVANDYYNKYLKGKQLKLSFDTTDNNREIKDLEMLLKFIKENNINAAIVLQPLNACAYKNLKDFLPIKRKIDSLVRNSNIDYLDMYTADSTKYEKGILYDVMHLGDYGWYKIDKFLIDKYIKHGMDKTE